jgi:hypothetical protein
MNSRRSGRGSVKPSQSTPARACRQEQDRGDVADEVVQTSGVGFAFG